MEHSYDPFCAFNMTLFSHVIRSTEQEDNMINMMPKPIYKGFYVLGWAPLKQDLERPD